MMALINLMITRKPRAKDYQSSRLAWPGLAELHPVFCFPRGAGGGEGVGCREN